GEDLDGAIQQLRQMRIRYVVFNGGNGTMRGADIFRQHCRSTGYDVQIVGVPKTIDNDIAHTDRCPGFGSAARYVAQSTLDLAMDIRSLPQPVSIFETLGRDVGWLAASSTAAKLLPDDAPHLVLVPEVPFSEETFLGALDGVVRRLGWAVVVVSEGISYADGTPVFQQVVKGRNGSSNRPLIGGVAQYLSGLVNERLGIRGRSEKPGLIGRSCMAYRSPQDVKDAELVGRAAVRALLAGETGQMIALEPIAASRPDSTRLIPLSEAGGSQRRIPTEWLSGEMLGVTDQFRDYIKPLIGELSYYRNSLSRRSVRV
ncbi:MAG TPA: diphosphate--fructose-6-phosphate 1-phosphotransferase, partial [Acidobacteriaceae bacterium]|nr:diphosphate--fructose-6-phosphate 1-phosphotransferase [Acidobacteriaceae bacterium]